MYRILATEISRLSIFTGACGIVNAVANSVEKHCISMVGSQTTNFYSAFACLNIYTSCVRLDARCTQTKKKFLDAVNYNSYKSLNNLGFLSINKS